MTEKLKLHKSRRHGIFPSYPFYCPEPGCRSNKTGWAIGFRCKRKMIKHAGDFHCAPGNFQCPVCLERFGRSKALRSHIRRAHEGKAPSGAIITKAYEDGMAKDYIARGVSDPKLAWSSNVFPLQNFDDLELQSNNSHHISESKEPYQFPATIDWSLDTNAVGLPGPMSLTESSVGIQASFDFNFEPLIALEEDSFSFAKLDYPRNNPFGFDVNPAFTWAATTNTRNEIASATTKETVTATVHSCQTDLDHEKGDSGQTAQAVDEACVDLGPIMYKRSREPSPVISNNNKRKKASHFQCTFCLKMIGSKSWKRHEETVHLPRYQWICQPNGPQVTTDNSDVTDCAFCNFRTSTGDTHSPHCHRAAECTFKPVIDRSFQRKDHLRQHCKKFHQGAVPDNDILESWKTEADYSHHNWYCGFCGENLDGWDARARHIGQHFRAGLTMEDWDLKKYLATEDEISFQQFLDGLSCTF
ncbi:hypothetical protein BT63DRAFT_412277 [Microthyrium microscopicum]|uniref:C2H2-type domain-containing protein n=1 Tax=Microthyrium microscopicum TaxID=703497 RepID=A0A6A6UI44_9PEZI|nr:hypothetical protein BT63DRAFT_412277 [Microthyrium microscopicum]